MLNYKHLQYFLQVAKSGSVNRAAEKLHLTPQTLSGQIKGFEERLGVELFQRSGRRLELTESGKLALSYADEIFRIGAELEDRGLRPDIDPVEVHDWPAVVEDEARPAGGKRGRALVVAPQGAVRRLSGQTLPRDRTGHPG